MRKVTFIAIAFFLSGLCQTVLGQQFEKPLLNGSPELWYCGSGGMMYGHAYRGILDSSISRSGKNSIRIESIGVPLNREFGELTSVIPGDSVRGKKVHIAAWVRTQNVTDYADLWVNDGVRLGNTVTIPGGTNDWRQYSVDLTVDSNARYLFIGGVVDGQGTGWFDDFQIQIDGKDYRGDTNFLSKIRQTEALNVSLTENQLSWLRTHILPLKTTDPVENLSDLEPLNNIVGNAKIVALGETAHGSHQFFQLKQRIVEYLAKNLGFTIVAVEADLPESAAINNYVLHGVGDPDTLLRSPYFWNWNTEEMLDLVKWMRTFNVSGVGRIQFCGYGIQYITNAAGEVQAFLNNHDSSIASIAQTDYTLAKELILRSRSENGYNRDHEDSASWALAINDSRELEHRLQSYSAPFRRSINPDSLAWIVEDAHVITQELEEILGYNRGRYVRDSNLAENVQWLINHHPENKIILYPYGPQNVKDSGAMGYRLSKLYGDNYVSIGFAFDNGTYLANGAGERTSDTALAGTAEYAFHRLEKPLWMLDMNTVRTTSDTAANWLRQPARFRMMSGTGNDIFTIRTLSKSFDALIYVDHSDATHPLSNTEN